MNQGIISKVVRASFPGPAFKSVAGRARQVAGYGIIRASDGSEILFLHTAVVDDRFDELRRGQHVEFTLELGPARLAKSVRPLVREPVPPAVENG